MPHSTSSRAFNRFVSPRPVWRAALLCMGATAPALAGQLDIAGPAGSASFGAVVLALPNGNVIVGDPAKAGATSAEGAVYVYSASGALISTLTGSSPNDRVGQSLRLLGNGDFVVISPGWNGGRGAVTRVDGTTGLSGTVSASNSLVGITPNDRVGNPGVLVVGGSHYIVASSYWSNGAIPEVGAVTWCNGATGCTGPVTMDNSLYGGSANDHIGLQGTAVLSNGNYVVISQQWDSAVATDVGAFTWANGSTGRTGPVLPVNSLVGSHTRDALVSTVTPLRNGNYVVSMASWANGAVTNAGAVAWGSGTSGVAGAVSPANALTGSTMNDYVGIRVTALSNGNYVVVEPAWDNGAAINVGAATWCNGSTGRIGPVSATNSLIGPGDSKGPIYATALSNGNYVVRSPTWDAGGAASLGAVTWANGSTGLVGVVSAANSLIGAKANDEVGGTVTALRNGHYVVNSPYVDGVAQETGAVTWADGNVGLVGTVSAANSLVGTSAFDNVGERIVALSNGNYVVASSVWNSPTAIAVGAVTWGNGNGGLVGPVSAANSLTGATASDGVGDHVIALSNGNYVVSSFVADIGTHEDAGAVTWVDGATGMTGTVSASNSLVGSAAFDRVGSTGLLPLPDGNYAVRSFDWNNGLGAITLGRGTAPLVGTIDASNSVRGTDINSTDMVSDYDASHHQLVVGRPGSNIVSVFSLSDDAIFANGFEP